MDVSEWAVDSWKNVQDDGLNGAQKSLRPVYRKIIEQRRRFQPPGDNIYDSKWDLLIIVDACRLDLMKEVASEFDYIEQINRYWSVDSTTSMWMKRTFEKQDTSDTTYICSNPFSAERLNPTDFDELDEVWRHSWAEPGTVPPRVVTDRTIEQMRSRESTRTIAHYLQPHCPFIPKPNISKGKEVDKFGKQDHRDVWELYREGDLALHELWDGYRQNLRLVLEDIKLLLENVSAEKVVITSDHGNALGKWGIYGHPPRMPHKSLREVPWIETSAEDTGDHSPEVRIGNSEENAIDRMDKLEALGYA